MSKKPKKNESDVGIVKRPTVDRDAVPVKDMPVTWKMIQLLASTNSIPERYWGKPGDILATMKLAQEHGIGEFEALLEVYMVNGKPALSGKLLAAMIWRAGHQLICTTGKEVATVRSIRRLPNGEMLELPVVEFTLEEADHAGLLGKDNWEAYPKAMLAWRAITLAARVNFPDVVSALSYMLDEIYEGSDLVMAEAEKNVTDVLEAEYVEEIVEATPREKEG